MGWLKDLTRMPSSSSRELEKILDRDTGWNIWNCSSSVNVRGNGGHSVQVDNGKVIIDGKEISGVSGNSVVINGDEAFVDGEHVDGIGDAAFACVPVDIIKETECTDQLIIRAENVPISITEAFGDKVEARLVGNVDREGVDLVCGGGKVEAVVPSSFCGSLRLEVAAPSCVNSIGIATSNAKISGIVCCPTFAARTSNAKIDVMAARDGDMIMDLATSNAKIKVDLHKHFLHIVDVSTSNATTKLSSGSGENGTATIAAKTCNAKIEIS